MKHLLYPYDYRLARAVNALIFSINLSYTFDLIRIWKYHRSYHAEMTFWQFLYFMLSDIWKVVEFVCCFGIFFGTILRQSQKGELDERALMATASVLMAFKLIYFFRAFETTGRLVAYMIQIVHGIGYFIVILGIIVVGFSFAFWIMVSNDPYEEKLAAANISGFFKLDSALVTTFSYMMGQYSSQEFTGVHVHQFERLFYVALVIITSIIMLNLLITIMGDIYQMVNCNARGQFLWEQANVIANLMHHVKDGKKKNADPLVLHCLKVSRVAGDEIDNEPPNAADFGAPYHILQMDLPEHAIDPAILNNMTQVLSKVDEKLDYLDDVSKVKRQ